MSYLKDENDKEILQILEWLKKNELDTFPYKWAKKYKKINIEIKQDNNKCNYYLYKNRRMYLNPSFSVEQCKEYIKGILLEQDVKSPHRYNVDISMIKEKIVADIGAAEGFFILDYIKYIKKAYIFECDDEWVKALKLTFKKEIENGKVEVCKKYVDEKNSETSISLDSFFSKKNIDFIKADIEGYEIPMLKGANDVLGKIDNIVIAVYHRQADEKQIGNILRKFNFRTQVNKGYMFFKLDKNQIQPYVRRGVMFGEKIKVE